MAYTTQRVSPTVPPESPDIADQIRKLEELRDVGVLSVEEFDAKKTQLLKRL